MGRLLHRIEDSLLGLAKYCRLGEVGKDVALSAEGVWSVGTFRPN